MMFPSAFSKELWEKIHSAKLLVIGAGGIGCELLKNLILTGFKDIEVVDLDTIDVSNLNRQFLFHKEHVGKPKSIVARNSVLRYNPKAKIIARHGSIISPEYGVNYFKQFTVVLNALDNQAARSYVNRMCLAAGTPLIDSGTAGYEGQVEVISKGLTLCYECLPKPPQKTYPSCTIRNHPSEHIHCTIWAKHLFNQLFGEDNEEEDISPDLNDPELQENHQDGEVNNVSKESKQRNDGSGENGNKTENTLRVTDLRFNPHELFDKVFNDDIQYLLTMKHLWKNRRPPLPLNWNNLPDAIEGSSKSENHAAFKDQIQWTISECRDVFSQSINSLKKRLEALGEGALLTWDKDDDPAMNFVAAAANLRAHIFGIPLKTKFETKAMAGNIVPAIATSNAVIAGLVTLQTLKILRGEIKNCTPVYLRRFLNPRGVMIMPEKFLSPPNPKCDVCSNKPQITLVTNIETFTCEDLEKSVLKKSLQMIAPDVVHNDRIILSSEEGETNHNNNKTLAELNILNGSFLIVDDYLQNFQFRMFIEHLDAQDKGRFLFTGDVEKILERKPSEEPKSDEVPASASSDQKKDHSDSGSDCEMLEDTVNFVDCYNSKKRKLESSPLPSKKKKFQGSNSDPITIN